MSALGPRDISDDVLYRDDVLNGASVSSRHGDRGEIDERLIGKACIRDTLASEAVAEVVNEIVGDEEGVTGREALVIGERGAGGGLTGKYRRSGLAIILQIAAPEDRVLAVDIPIETRDVGVVRALKVVGEAVADGIQAVTLRGVIAYGI